MAIKLNRQTRRGVSLSVNLHTSVAIVFHQHEKQSCFVKFAIVQMIRNMQSPQHGGEEGMFLSMLILFKKLFRCTQVFESGYDQKDENNGRHTIR